MAENQTNDLQAQITQRDEQIKALQAQITEKENTINQNKSTIEQKDKQIAELQTADKNKETQINKLTNEIKTKENQINELNSKVSQLSEKDNIINDLNKQLTEKTNSEKNKIDEINKKNEEFNKLKDDFNKSKIDNENKIKEKGKELSEKESKINELQNKIKSNEEIRKLKEDNKLITLENEKLKKIIMPSDPLINKKITNDISLSFDNIKSIKEGWDLSLSELGLKYFNTPIKCQKVGILGNKRVGKSFILSHLFGLNYPQIPIHSSQKISIKIKQRKNKIKFMIFDSQGFNTPILEEKNINELNDANEVKIEQEKNEKNINNKEKKEEKNNKEINISDKEQNITLINGTNSFNNISNSCFNLSEEEIEGIKKKHNLEELIINKFLTEEFITSFMVDYSDLLIVVVGLLNHSDQELLNKVMEECVKKDKKNLYIVHNLQSFITKEQVNNYIKNILMNSATFELEEKKEIIMEDLYNSDEGDDKENLEEGEDVTPNYYTSKYKSLTVNHLIFINENSDEKFFNEFTKKKMANFFNNSQSTEFNIYEKIKNKIFELLNGYSKNEIKEENIKFEENQSEKNSRKIIYKGDENLKLRRYLKNEESETRSEFRPKYSYYTSNKEGKEKLYILIETPGEITDENINLGKTKNNKEYLIQYKGKKCLSEEENKQKDNIKIVGREFGEFILDIPIPLKGYEILNLKEPKCHNEKGIEIIEYELKNISNINIELKNGNYEISQKEKNNM